LQRSIASLSQEERKKIRDKRIIEDWKLMNEPPLYYNYFFLLAASYVLGVIGFAFYSKYKIQELQKLADTDLEKQLNSRPEETISLIENICFYLNYILSKEYLFPELYSNNFHQKLVALLPIIRDEKLITNVSKTLTAFCNCSDDRFVKDIVHNYGGFCQIYEALLRFPNNHNLTLLALSIGNHASVHDLLISNVNNIKCIDEMLRSETRTLQQVALNILRKIVALENEDNLGSFKAFVGSSNLVKTLAERRPILSYSKDPDTKKDQIGQDKKMVANSPMYYHREMIQVLSPMDVEELEKQMGIVVAKHFEEETKRKLIKEQPGLMKAKSRALWLTNLSQQSIAITGSIVFTTISIAYMTLRWRLKFPLIPASFMSNRKLLMASYCALESAKYFNPVQDWLLDPEHPPEFHMIVRQFQFSKLLALFIWRYCRFVVVPCVIFDPIAVHIISSYIHYYDALARQ
jgi:hypothetical protein